MNLLGHSGADLINTWGFAYVGGVIGLFSLSLLYVKAPPAEAARRERQPAPRSACSAPGREAVTEGEERAATRSGSNPSSSSICSRLQKASCVSSEG